MDEITKRPWGQLAVRTWAQAHASLSLLPESFAASVAPLFEFAPSSERAHSVKIAADRALLSLQLKIKLTVSRPGNISSNIQLKLSMHGYAKIPLRRRTRVLPGQMVNHCKH